METLQSIELAMDIHFYLELAQISLAILALQKCKWIYKSWQYKS